MSAFTEDPGPVDRPAILRDPEVQAAFDAHGFVILPLLDGRSIRDLGAIYRQWFPEAPAGFFSSSYLPDLERKRSISDDLVRRIEPHLAPHLAEVRILGAAFLSKGPGSSSALPHHQDWTIVDENRYVAANVWTPLLDTDTTNGTLEVLPGSHRHLRTLRAPTIPFLFDGRQHELDSGLLALRVRATEAVIVDQALIHGSPSNESSGDRIAVTTGICSREAPLRFYYWDDDSSPGTLERYDVPDDFLIRFEDFHHDIFRRPASRHPVERRTYELPAPSIDGLEACRQLSSRWAADHPERVAPRR